MVASNKSPVKWQHRRQLAQEGRERERVRVREETRLRKVGWRRETRGVIMAGRTGRWRETRRAQDEERERGGLLPHMSRFASPERKFSTNALCTLGLRRIGRAIPTTATVYARIALMRVGRVADDAREKGCRSYFAQMRCESRREADRGLEILPFVTCSASRNIFSPSLETRECEVASYKVLSVQR